MADEELDVTVGNNMSGLERPPVLFRISTSFFQLLLARSHSSYSVQGRFKMLSATPINLLAGLVVFASGILLISFAATVYVRPAIAERFLMLFASSARAHYLEQTLRLVMGASIVVLSPAMWQPTAFSVLGWSIVVSSLALMLIPWTWHHRLGNHILPKLVRHMKLFAAAVFAFGALLLFALSTSLSRNNAVGNHGWTQMDTDSEEQVLEEKRPRRGTDR